jgi:isopentenyldiphosphate isomerase
VVRVDGGIRRLSAADELVDVVDELDRVVGSAPRSRIRAERLRHRVASILVFRPDGRLLVHRRTATKDLFPGALDCFVGGVVGAGERYEEARDRELAEEMAIAGVEPVELFRFRYDGPEDRSWTSVSAVAWDGPVVPQAAEVAWHAWEPVERILERAAETTFVPDGREVLARWVELGSPRPPGTVGSGA